MTDFIRYCPVCRWVPGPNYKSRSCKRCMNRGHMPRLVESEADRQWRIEHWRKTYERWGRKPPTHAGTSWVGLHNPVTADEEAA